MDKYVNNTPAKVLRYQVVRGGIFELIQVIFKIYAHIMGEVEIDGLNMIDALSVFTKAFQELDHKVETKIWWANALGDPINADLMLMVNHVHNQTSECKKCFDAGCKFCDGSMDQHI